MPFFARDTVRVARDLLGCVLESAIDGALVAGRVVEVEAYVGSHDPADHGYRNRRTARNRALFGAPGTLYVFRSYGVHWCVNAVTERAGVPTAVLVRALEPVQGLDVMVERRGVADARLACSGPGRLCQALGITGVHDGLSLVDGPLRVLRRKAGTRRRIVVGPRIGISRAKDWPLRFCLPEPRWLSRPAGASGRRVSASGGRSTAAH
jgi:DNA-3-methyladenine glycosylase